MKVLSLALLIAAFSIANVSGSDIEKLELKNGNAFVVVETEYSRNMPWAYYDQAIESIPLIYPDAVIVIGERLGKTDENNEVLYSLVGYKENNDSRYVVISGIATYRDRAWTFETRVEEIMFAQSVHLVLQQLSQLPHIKRMQTDQPTYHARGLVADARL